MLGQASCIQQTPPLTDPHQGMRQKGRKLGVFGLEAAAALGCLRGGD